MPQQTREYHHRIQQANAQAWEQLRQQEQASPAAPRSIPSSPAVPLSPPGLIVRSNVAGLKSPATSSLGKRVGNEKETDHVEKRSKLWGEKDSEDKV